MKLGIYKQTSAGTANIVTIEFGVPHDSYVLTNLQQQGKI